MLYKDLLKFVEVLKIAERKGFERFYAGDMDLDDYQHVEMRAILELTWLHKWLMDDRSIFVEVVLMAPDQFACQLYWRYTTNEIDNTPGGYGDYYNRMLAGVEAALEHLRDVVVETSEEEN